MSCGQWLSRNGGKKGSRRLGGMTEAKQSPSVGSADSGITRQGLGGLAVLGEGLPSLKMLQI